MSIPIKHADFGLDLGEPIIITATLWRGAMIDRYAQIEFFIDRTLSNCVSTAIITKSQAAMTLPRQRCTALMGALSDARLADMSGPALKSLRTVFEAWDDRNALCHGRLQPAAKSVAIRWTAHEKNAGTPMRITLTPVEMLEKLAHLDRLKSSLGSQLGAIDKACARLADQPL